MAERRTYGSYNDGCAAAHALDLIGDRWTMIVVRELLLGPKRFVDLQRDVLGIGPTVLTRRLGDLVSHGVATKQRVDGAGSVEVYQLTAWGQRLEQVNNALAAWAVESPFLPWDADMSPDTLVLTMRAHARPGPQGSRQVAIALNLIDSRLEDDSRGPVTYHATVSPVGTTISKGHVSEPDATLTATTRALKAAVLTDADLLGHSEATVRGSRRAVDLLLEATRLGGAGTH